MADLTLVLRAVRDEATDTRSFLFDAEGLAGVDAGQYLMVKLDVPADTRRGSRSFTMANAPTERPVMITTRIRPTSPFKVALSNLVPGSRIAAKGPFGKFVLPTDDGPSVFLAGGIGVTPFRSMIRHAIETDRPLPITLLTSDRAPDAIPFRAEMDAWARDHTFLRVRRTITHPTREAWSGRIGRMDAAWIRENVPKTSETTAFVAGSPAFVAGIRELLHGIGWPDERIRFEQFIGY